MRARAIGVGVCTLALAMGAASCRTAPIASNAGAREEARSLQGEPLFAPEIAPERRMKLEADLAEAEGALRAAPGDEQAIIWVARRQGYLGRFRDAVETLTKGLARHPESFRMLCHRGHRWITLREFDRAERDLARAAALAEGRPDEIEPDGAPNALGIPRSTTKSNIWYHLALARYLKGDFAGAAEAWERCMEFSTNDDMRCATANWLYLSLRRAGRGDEAQAVLAPIRASMDVVENFGYHRLLLFYKGEMTEAQIRAAAESGEVERASILHGVGAWMLCEGRRDDAARMFREVVSAGPWPAFGVIAAEAELARADPR